MPIQVTCHACRFTGRVKDELAGKQVKCPRCGRRFQVPAAEVEEDEPLDVLPDDSDEAEDEVPRGRRTGDAKRCPECRTRLDPDQVVCVECGYDFRTREK